MREGYVSDWLEQPFTFIIYEKSEKNRNFPGKNRLLDLKAAPEYGNIKNTGSIEIKPERKKYMEENRLEQQNAAAQEEETELETEEQLSELLQIRRDKLAALKAEGKDP